MNKRKITKYIAIAVAVISSALIFSGCFMGEFNSTMVTPEIRAIGLPDSTIVDSITLKVTGPDMDPVEVSYSSIPSVINLAIPEGNDRSFELTVSTGPAYIGTIATFTGTATSDINSDGTVVTLNMGIGSTKIIVPDYSNSRVLQFDDISGSNEVTLSALDNPVFAAWLTANTISGFLPNDIDFDSQGRIYIANTDPSEGIIRVDNIQGLNPYAFGVSSQVVALTVDRKKNVIYYTDGTTVYSNNLEGSDPQLINGIGGEGLYGLTIDNQYLYMADNGGIAIIKYDLTNNTSITFNNTGNILSSPWDVMVKGDKLFVANLNGAADNQILELNTSDLSLTGYYGTSTSSVDTTAGMFYGPRRFVAQMNDEITIIDDTFGIDKLIQMDNITGDNWKTLPNGPTDDGQLLFMFFSGGQY